MARKQAPADPAQVLFELKETIAEAHRLKRSWEEDFNEARLEVARLTNEIKTSHIKLLEDAVPGIINSTDRQAQEEIEKLIKLQQTYKELIEELMGKFAKETAPWGDQASSMAKDIIQVQDAFIGMANKQEEIENRVNSIVAFYGAEVKRMRKISSLIEVFIKNSELQDG